ncbi:MAG: hypothetical protein ACXACY_10370 [Candidatus Hodarchaeales archaeon]|jgi:hypothetical protein
MSDRVIISPGFDWENFDPFSIDVSEFKELANSMPRDGNLDIPNLETLAARFLRAADRCSEILSKIVLVENKRKANKNTIRQRLFLAAKAEGHSTVKDREAYAESHDNYIIAEDKYNSMIVAHKYFLDKQKWFLESHIFMKNRLRGEYKHQSSSGFSETAGQDKTWGEKSW